MKQLWLKYAAKFEALSERERIIVFVAALVVSVYLLFALVVEPAQRRAQALRHQITQEKAEMDAMQARDQLQARRETDPDAANRARGEELRRNIDALDATLKATQRDLVSADRMNALLREMLTRDSGLQLVGLRTLPVAPLIGKVDAALGAIGATAAPPKSTVAEANVYKHGVEITISGSYANLHAYLVRLERSPWRMFWWRARLTADDDARLTMVLTIYTLSLDRAWLQV
jgi:MSHA biogenesis protein MshJ